MHGSLSLLFLLRPMSASVRDPAATVEVERYENDDNGDEAIADRAGYGQKLAPVLAEDVADGGADEGPARGGSETVGEKVTVLHVADPGEEGGHAPEAGAEASEEDRLAAVSLEVALDLVQALGVEQERQKPDFQDAVDQGPSTCAPDPIDHVIRDGSTYEAYEHHQWQDRPAVVGEETAGEHYEVSRRWQTEVVQRRAQEDDEVTVGEEQVRNEIEQTSG